MFHDFPIISLYHIPIISPLATFPMSSPGRVQRADADVASPGGLGVFDEAARLARTVPAQKTTRCADFMEISWDLLGINEIYSLSLSIYYIYNGNY